MRLSPRLSPVRFVWAAVALVALLGAMNGLVWSAPSGAAPGGGNETVPGGPTGTYVVPARIHKIRHVIVIMQENRSFDTYFGTYPGADGIPRRPNGKPSVCVPVPANPCIRPFHSTADINAGWSHGHDSAITDEDGGKMDGFIPSLDQSDPTCATATGPRCQAVPGAPAAIMGFHNQREVPNYWSYAQHFVLDDHMFEPVSSWSLPDHLYMVSGWSAKCRDSEATSCRTDLSPYGVTQFDSMVTQYLQTGRVDVDLAWTDITWLLHRSGVSWAYYVESGHQPDCSDDDATSCPEPVQNAKTPGIWNPLPLFDDVRQDGQQANIEPLGNYFVAAAKGQLPSVSWITPSWTNSDHPSASVHEAQAYVTALINAAMKSPDWSSTAIFLSWDDWGGFYDHVMPPTVDANGYGLRVPSLVISPYAKKGYIDHATYSSDAYLKFIEDDFLSGARLDPTTDQRPDPRPDVRENEPGLGNLLRDFNFRQTPQPPLLLPTNPPTDSPTVPMNLARKSPCTGCTAIPSWKRQPQVKNPNRLPS